MGRSNDYLIGENGLENGNFYPEDKRTSFLHYWLYVYVDYSELKVILSGKVPTCRQR